MLGNDIDEHAWVEVEVENNLWQVIEPQTKSSLERMHTRFYFPKERSLILEDKKQNYTEDTTSYLRTRYRFLPANLDTK